MRLKYFITSLILYPLLSFANNNLDPSIILDTTNSIEKNTIKRSLVNERVLTKMNQNFLERSSEYPTQIIRMTQSIEHQQLNCKQVNEQINKIFINKITKDKFTYDTYISCTYNPETYIATQFTLSSYFDPLSDEAIEYLKLYLDEYNGIDLLGSPLSIESAKAVIVSLNLSVGVKKNFNKPPFIEYREDRSNFYFKNNYELQTKLIADIQQRFLTDEEDKILPFLDKWLFNHAGMLYKAILRDSNFAQLQPERIFLMDNGEPIFVSPIKYYYAHDCNQYEHHHCLKQEL